MPPLASGIAAGVSSAVVIDLPCLISTLTLRITASPLPRSSSPEHRIHSWGLISIYIYVNSITPVKQYLAFRISLICTGFSDFTRLSIRDVVLESRTWTRVRLGSRFLGLGLGLETCGLGLGLATCGLGLDTSGLETWTWHTRTWTWFSISLMENPDSQSEILNHLFWKSIKADPIGSSLFSKLLWHWIYLTVYKCIKLWRNHYEAT